MKKESIISAVKIFLIVLAFILISYFAQVNSELLKDYIKDNIFGMIIYVFILIVFSILAPINEIILVPIATASWGWFITALLTLTGWTLGSAVVFFISKRFGVPIIKKFIPLSKIYKYEKFMPQEHLFLSVIFLRIAVPIDIISYMIGLFTNIKFSTFIFATFIGFTPLAFLLAYLGTLPMYIQLIGLILLLVISVIGFLSMKYKHTKKELKNKIHQKA